MTKIYDESGVADAALVTKPTQAQIEALTANLRFLATKKDGDPNISRVASSILIEAADTLDALTAAAEVGDNEVSYSEDDLREIINANIERCAQVADEYKAEQTGTATRIAAAIRALKEKP